MWAWGFFCTFSIYTLCCLYIDCGRMPFSFVPPSFVHRQLKSHNKFKCIIRICVIASFYTYAHKMKLKKKNVWIRFSVFWRGGKEKKLSIYWLNQFHKIWNSDRHFMIYSNFPLQSLWCEQSIHILTWHTHTQTILASLAGKYPFVVYVLFIYELVCIGPIHVFSTLILKSVTQKPLNAI